MPNALRTPDERFVDLPNWTHDPHYVDDLPGYDGLRMHYVDAGPSDAEEVFLCLHGQPTWSYLYRKMIPVFAEAGKRVIAPDLFGFGRSDKPADESTYTFDFHRGSILALIERLKLRNLTLVVQDWGGLIGLTLPMEIPGRVSRLLVMNTGLATGLTELPPAFQEWRAWNKANPDMKVAELMGRACPTLSAEERAAYEAPYPDATYKAGVRQFPELVADRPDAPGADTARQAAGWLKTEWSGQSFMAIGMQDEILGPPAMMLLHSIIRGCPDPLELAEVGHFVQEHGEEVARAALDSFKTS